MMMAAARIGTTMTHHGKEAGGWGLVRTTRAAGITEIWAYMYIDHNILRLSCSMHVLYY